MELTFPFACMWVMVQYSLNPPGTHHGAQVGSTIGSTLVPIARKRISGKKPRMDAANAWIVAWISLHIVALATAFGTRIAVGSCLESLFQIAFYAAMLMMGGAIWACQQTHAGAWGLSAVTLIAMVLTAVVDFRKLGDARSVGQAY